MNTPGSILPKTAKLATLCALFSLLSIFAKLTASKPFTADRPPEAVKILSEENSQTKVCEDKDKNLIPCPYFQNS
ncbi:MAG: hypothetical protein SXA11_06970 [Cyanobacteriota bacterium]|nr:hypothetical protein [Cyanobacteriota bacterium]